MFVKLPDLTNYVLFSPEEGLARIKQCWALAPLLAPPRHWRELKKVAYVAVALKQKIIAWWQWRENKMALIRAISVPF